MAFLNARRSGRLLASMLSLWVLLAANAAGVQASKHHRNHHRGAHHRHRHCRSSSHRVHRRRGARCAVRGVSPHRTASSAGGPQDKGQGNQKHSAPPTNTSLPSISGSALQGQTLTASSGSWSGTNPIAYAYQWQRAGSNISGASGASYALSASDVGYTIAVVVTARNSVGSSSATSVSTAAVAASTPPEPPPPAPGAAVASLSPSSGPEAGGTSVSITGTNFSGVTAVKFGSSSAAGYTVNSASLITAVSPPGRGTVDVTVSTTAGTSPTGSSDRFSYAAQPPSGAAGAVRFVKVADSSFDAEDIESNASFMWEHFTRMIGFTSFFDSRTAWAPPAWVYQDAYAIYAGSSLEKEHPEWILRDASGNKLYIPYGNPPSQFAGDISNPAFRQFWIQRTKGVLARGYRGVFVDDVDMWANTGNANGEKVVPISGVTGTPISNEAWREYMATFMRELREATPGYEIVHNKEWDADGGSANRGTTAPVVRSEIAAADVLNIERGVNDGGLTGGTGAWSLANLFTYIDEAHAMGKAVTLDGTSSVVAGMEYNLAAYFLISTGKDYVSGGGSSQTIKSFWAGWSVNLGEATGPRERSSLGLWSRRFTGGVVYLLEPGAATQTIILPSTMHSVTLGSVSSITLSARQAAVLLTT